MPIELLTRVVGPVVTNVHVLGDTDTKEAIAIDTATPSLAWIAAERMRGFERHLGGPPRIPYRRRRGRHTGSVREQVWRRSGVCLVAGQH